MRGPQDCVSWVCPGNEQTWDCFVASFAVIKKGKCEHSARYCFSAPSSPSSMTSTKPVPFTVVVPWLPSTSWSLKHRRDVVWWIGSLFLRGSGSVWDCRLFSPNLTPGYVFYKPLFTYCTLCLHWCDFLPFLPCNSLTTHFHPFTPSSIHFSFSIIPPSSLHSHFSLSLIL